MEQKVTEQKRKQTNQGKIVKRLNLKKNDLEGTFLVWNSFNW